MEALNFRRCSLLTMDYDHFAFATSFLNNVIANLIGRQNVLTINNGITRFAIRFTVNVDDGNSNRACEACWNGCFWSRRDVDQRINLPA